MTDIDPADAKPARYWLAFLSDERAWEADLRSETLEQAKAVARQALLDLVREEKPELACVTLIEGDVKIGVWDWVERQPYWTPL